MMVRQIAFGLLSAAALLTAAAAWSADFGYAVPMKNSNRLTYYVDVGLGDLPPRQFLVDTGSSHMAIDDASLRLLQGQGEAHFVGNLVGTMADGSKRRVPLYEIDRLVIGDRCVVRDVRAAVIPGADRNILGLSVLRRLAPFSMDTEPPTLRFSRCRDPVAATARNG